MRLPFLHAATALLLLLATTTRTAAALGFTTYKEIREGEGADNAGAVAYSPLDRSAVLFLYIQIVAGWDHGPLMADFRALAANYGPEGVAVIPRVRYGHPDGSVAAEPADASVILEDAAAWAAVFAEAADTIDVPVIQAGFLGLWGEWHDGPFCPAQGADDTPANLAVKRQVVEALQRGAGGRSKIALRYPRDHRALFPDDRAVTLHNDCIFSGGPGGSDGGTFPPEGDGDRQEWVDYAKRVAGGNAYGGEGCDQAGDSTYDWADWGHLCGEGGLVPYIHEFQIAYMNPGNPAAFQQLFLDGNWSGCVDAIQAALQSYT